MKLLILWLSITSVLATLTVNNQLFSQFLLYGRYGTNIGRRCHWVRSQRAGGRPHLRCHRDNSDLLQLALAASLTPVPVKQCFPDYATVERQTTTGTETISIANLTLGDEVKCLKAPLGPRTAAPNMGWCKFVSRGHDEPTLAPYEQIIFEGGEMVAASAEHLLWSSRASLKGTVDAKSLDITNAMFVPAKSILPGDTIVSVDNQNQLQYRVVIAHHQANMTGIHNPAFEDGGMPIVSGVLATDSASSSGGGHWGTYFQHVWIQDQKFKNVTAVKEAQKSHPFYMGQQAGSIKVDTECLLDHIVGDIQKGVDVTNYTSYESFIKVYSIPCAELKLADVAKAG